MPNNGFDMQLIIVAFTDRWVIVVSYRDTQYKKMELAYKDDGLTKGSQSQGAHSGRNKCVDLFT